MSPMVSCVLSRELITPFSGVFWEMELSVDLSDYISSARYTNAIGTL